MKVEKYLFCLIFVIGSSKTAFGEFCRLPTNEAGSCVLLNDCEILKQSALLKEENDEIRNYLNQSRCKDTNVPWVCCPLRNNQHLQSRIDRTHQTKLLPGHLGFCGRQADLSIRIIGGEDVSPGEFPWHALLVYRKSSFMDGYHCGGSLITSTHVLTAAHCTDRRLLPSFWNLISVRLGENDINSIENCKTSNDKPPKCGIEVLISNIIIHDLYAAKQGSPNDIAIIKLKDSVKYSDYIMPICLPIKKNISTNSGTGTVIGFGMTENGSSSDTLLKTEISIQNFSDCKKKYRSQRMQIQGSQICATGENSDSCSGDSGGGFVRKDQSTSVWYLIGIISYGPKRCNSQFPGVYVKVQNYIHWIKEKIKE
ncbi:melanization protease 1-like [Chironomus tepperi]|uniref:melanization protease 1-like n=1 Tax=Chironomus tepperi TaxID=113505 RepID=UPI00391F1567